MSNSSELTRAALRRGILVTGSGTGSQAGALTAAMELLNLGYLVIPTDLENISDSRLVKVIDAAREVSGSDRAFRPMYPNFPAQVRNLSSLQLLVDQILHYITGETPLVDITVEARPGLPLRDMLTASKPLRVVRYGELPDEVSRVVASAAAMSEEDFAFVRAAFHREKVRNALVGIIDASRNKENRQKALLAYAANEYVSPENVVRVMSRALDADDLLRSVLAVYSLSGGDTEAYSRAAFNLSDRDNAAVHMNSVPRAVRRELARQLGNVTHGHRADALVARKRLWRNVSRYAHLFQYAGNADTKRALDIVHDNIVFHTYASRVEAALASGDVKQAVIVLEENPGQLIRRAAAMLRMGGDVEWVTAAIGRTGYRAKMSTLVSAYNGVSGLSTGRARVLRVAGRANRVMDGETCVSTKDAKAVMTALRGAMERKLAFNGALSDVTAVGTASTTPVELVRRDASTSDRSMSRGASVDVGGNGDTLRLFVQWYNMDDESYRHRVDLDLSAAYLTKGLESAGRIDWTSYTGHRTAATFSGDIVDAPRPNGAAEFIDLDLTRVPSNVEWVVMSVYSYTGQPLGSVEHFAGAMLRSDADAGAIFDPRTVTAAFRSVSRATSVAPLAVNVRTRKMVWLDTDSGDGGAGRSLSYGGDAIISAAAFELGVKRLTEGELARMYAKAVRARVTTDAVNGDLIDAIMSL